MIQGLTMLAQQGGGSDVAAAGAGIVFMLFICCALLIGPLMFVFWIWMLIDCVRRDFDGNEKIIWVLVIALLNWIGALVYFFIGRSKGRPPADREEARSPSSEA